MVGAVAEEAARRRVDPVGTASEIHTVEVKLEDLVFAELPLEGHCEDGFLELAREAAVVRQEDVARELLGDRRRRADSVVLGNRRGECTPDSDRVDTDMAAEPPVLGRDDRGTHLGRDLIVTEPLPEAWAE